MRWHSEGLQCFHRAEGVGEKMAEEEEDPWTRGLRLVSHLDAILEADPYMYAMAISFPLFRRHRRRCLVFKLGVGLGLECSEVSARVHHGRAIELC